jgi:phosphohistidine swiveling domain-containing protein
MSKRIISTKAGTLKNLAGFLRSASIPKIYCFTVARWNLEKEVILNEIEEFFFGAAVAVRSSSLNEDGEAASNAGCFESVLNVDSQNEKELNEAVIRVIESYVKKNCINDCDEVLVQEMVKDIIMSGVIFSCDPENLTPYFIVNYVESCDTTEITSGKSGDDEVFIHYRYSPYEVKDLRLKKLIDFTKELIEIIGSDHLDIEFAVDCSDNIYLLQVRNIVINNKRDLSFLDISAILKKLQKKIVKMQSENYNLLGNTTAFGVMPDWNPAEIIGVKPNSLALSLYQELITDYVWANHRKSYGFRDLKSSPLLTSFFGIPFVDIRIDFNSWIPANLDLEISRKLVNYYIKKFIDNKHLHDKVEFHIIFSCYVANIDDRINNLLNKGFSCEEIKKIKRSLIDVTNCAVYKVRENMDLIEILQKKQIEVSKSDNMYIIDKIYWLVNDCKRYGTYPFAGIARGAFIAVDMLNSFVDMKIMTFGDKEKFIRSLKTISHEFKSDCKKMKKEEFLEKYGHLRPSTYDITSLNYKEGYELYFNDDNIRSSCTAENEEYEFSDKQKEVIGLFLKDAGLGFNVDELIDFIRNSIIQREYSKFIFTKSVNDILELMKELGKRNDIPVERMAFCDIDIVLNMYYNIDHNTVRDQILNNITYNEELYNYTLALKFPNNITSFEEIYSFHNEESVVNFVTNLSVIAEVVYVQNLHNIDLKGKIVCVENADPGYEFLFVRGIVGLVTQYGGVNSHMAIRCSELNIPAAVGVGREKFDKLKCEKIIRIDCKKQIIGGVEGL